MPHRITAWTRQRTRWLKGFMLTGLVHTRNPARTWRTFGRAGTATMLTFMVGTPLLYLAQPVVLAIWASGYTGFAARHLQVSFPLAMIQLAIFVVWTALVIAAARRHKLTTAVFAPLLPAYWLMHWTASWRGLYQLIRAPFLWEKTPHTAAAE
jgi:glycosyltransferase XagB